VALALALGTCLTGTATAAVVTVGPQLSGSFTPKNFGGSSDPPATVLNAKLSPSLGVVTSPINGTVVSWSVVQAAGGPFKLRIIQPNGGLSVTAVGTSTGATPAGRGIESFPTSLPIKAGQLIALDNSRGPDEIGLLQDPGAEYQFSETALAEGSPTTLKPGPSPLVIGFNAQVLPPPTVTALSEKSGSIKGGAQVSITGTDLSRVSAVAFGTTPAAAVAVVSDTQIVAVAPPSKKPVSVQVSVTTPAGTASAPESFAYQACRVPALAGKKLRAARKRLKKSHCRIGRVRVLGDATRKSGEIEKQRPKAGKVLVPGAKVNVKLG
jgi:hypothetical protein